MAGGAVVSALSGLADALAASSGRLGVHAVLTVAVVVLWCEREALRAARGRRARAVGAALDRLLVPLLGLFGVVVLTRLLELT